MVNKKTLKTTRKSTKILNTKKATKKTTTKKKSQKTPTTKKNKTIKPLKETKRTKLLNIKRDNELIKTIVQGMLEKKANNITIMDLSNIENSFCNHFVICEAESKPQLQAITNSVEEFVRKKLSLKPHHIEGIQNAEWILLDYLTVIVHIFRSDVRDFYKIEDLWADARTEYITNFS